MAEYNSAIDRTYFLLETNQPSNSSMEIISFQKIRALNAL